MTHPQTALDLTMLNSDQPMTMEDAIERIQHLTKLVWEYAEMLEDSNKRIAFLESSAGIIELMERCQAVWFDALGDETGNVRLQDTSVDDRCFLIHLHSVQCAMQDSPIFAGKGLPAAESARGGEADNDPR